MERLTKKLKGIGGGYETVYNDRTIAEALGKYEDTQLTPAEIEEMKKENQGIRANSMIQEHIIKSGGNPLDKDMIVRLVMENSALKAENERLRKDGDSAVADMKIMADAIRESELLDSVMHEGCCFACKYQHNEECPGYDSGVCFEWRGPAD